MFFTVICDERKAGNNLSELVRLSHSQFANMKTQSCQRLACCCGMPYDHSEGMEYGLVQLVSLPHFNLEAQRSIEETTPDKVSLAKVATQASRQ